VRTRAQDIPAAGRDVISFNLLNDFHARKKEYGAIKTEYSGLKYDSEREAQVAAELQMRMLATGSDKIANIERQIRTPLVVNGQKICTTSAISSFRTLRVAKG
jgi:hypothetical protein